MNFINRIDNLYNNNTKIEIYLDMDGTVVEFLLNNEMNFKKKTGYLKKKPILPIIDIIETIVKKYPLINLNILSCSSTNQMKKEKNKWLDRYMPYICKENRIIFSEEDSDFHSRMGSSIKATYLSKSSNENIIFFIDDDVRNLLEVQKLSKNNIIPIHVTSLLM